MVVSEENVEETTAGDPVCARDREVAAQQKNLGGRRVEGGRRRQKDGRSDGVYASSLVRRIGDDERGRLFVGAWTTAYAR
jgi:hypothetical protein